MGNNHKKKQDRKIFLREEAEALAKELFADDAGRREKFVSVSLEMCERAARCDILLIHNPGGWGTTNLDNLLQWERSIVDGVGKTVDNLGLRWSLVQYFRSETGWIAIIRDIREQGRFFRNKARILAAALEFVTGHFPEVKVVLIGVSQGAAFSNAVNQYVGNHERVFTIELGIPFPYKSKRVITERTLTLDGNGLMPDALMEWDIPTILKTYFTAPLRWLKYRFQGKKVKFSYCINVPGHDYNWDYPEVQGQVERFINFKFGSKSDTEVGVR